MTEDRKKTNQKKKQKKKIKEHKKEKNEYKMIFQTSIPCLLEQGSL